MNEPGRETDCVADVLRAMESFAPRSLAAEGDNVGLILGHPDAPVRRALVALDVTPRTLNAAVERDAQLIVAHHPLLYHARRDLRRDDPEGELLWHIVRAGMNIVIAHTNWDSAEGGVNDVLCGLLGVSGVTRHGPFVRAGALRAPCGGAELGARVERALGGAVRVFGEARRIERLAVCGGAGSREWVCARDAGAQAFVTGEVRYDDALLMRHYGIVAYEAGHAATENVAIPALARGLQNALHALQSNIDVCIADCDTVC